MKKLLLLSGFSFLLQTLSAQTNKTWIGLDLGTWNTAGNWSPSGVPGATDTVIFNNFSNRCNVDINTSIASLKTAGTGGYLISTVANRIITINNNGSASPVLSVSSGTFLTLGGLGGTFGVSITTYGGASPNNAQIDGNLSFGYASTWTMSSGGFITNVDVSGVINPVSLSTPANLIINGSIATLRFLSGSNLTWGKNGGALPVADYQNGSTINITGTTSVMPTLSSSSNYNGLIIWNSNLGQTISGSSAVLLPTASSSIDSLRVINTGTGTLRLATEPAGYTIGHLEVQGGTLELSSPVTGIRSGSITTDMKISATGTVIGNATEGADAGFHNPMVLTVNGNLTVTGGTFNFTNRPATLNPGGAFQVYVKGNASQTAGTITSTTAFGSQNQLVMNGTSAQNLQLSNFTGTTSLVIGNSAGVSLLNNLSLPYYLVLQQGYMQLNNFNATIISPQIFQFAVSPTPKIVTNGSGMLKLTGIANAATASFPIGPDAAGYNPVSITNNSSTLDFSAKVETGIVPSIRYPIIAVNRTWTLMPSVTPSVSVDAVFNYSPGDGNAGFNYGTTVEAGQYTSVWNLIQTGLTPSGSYQVNVAGITSLGGNIQSPIAIGNFNSILTAANSVSLDHFNGVKQNGSHLLNWKVTCNNTPSVTMSMERSTDGINYYSIYSINATALQCQQPFSYTDANPAAGINYYRLKMTDANGKISYSSILPLINGARGIEILNIAPNPIAGGKFNLRVSAAQNTNMEITITDMQGRVLQKQKLNLIAGYNSIPVNVANLAAGTYQVYGNTEEGRSKILRFVVQ